MSGQIELTGAAVREPTGIALPARYSTREAGGGGIVASDEAAGRRFPQSAGVANVPRWRKDSGEMGLGSDQRPRRFCRASISAAA